MTTYLLDTNALSDVIRHPTGRVRQRLVAVGEESVCTSVIVACELRFGALKKDSKRLSQMVDDLLSELRVYPLEVAAQHSYATLRYDLERRGLPIGWNDLLIAAHAVSLDCILVTANTREFERVQGLTVEDWLA